MDLSDVTGLDTIIHFGPSSIGVDTIYRSRGAIAEEFLRNCGVPDDFIEYTLYVVGKSQALQFYSCFISYSTRDEEFVKLLHARLRRAHVRVWFAPKDMKGGLKLYDQIDHAIQVYDRLLIVLTNNSLGSEWVKTEIRKARAVEVEENRRKLFPIRLVDFETVQRWKCFDYDRGKDLGVELREYFIPDFSNWTDHHSFEKSFERLLNDLRASETRSPGAKLNHYENRY
jgi:TIR domain